MTRRVLTDLQIDKVAAVDRPCQEHAIAVIMKRAFTADERRQAAANGHAMSDGSYLIDNTQDLHNAIHAVGRGSGDHAAIRAHIITRAKALGATDQIPEDWNKETKMLKELAKVLGLPETATEADITKALADRDAKIAELTKAKDTAEALAKMSDKHKAFMDGGGKMPKGGKDAFTAMSSAERDAHCAENDADGDEGVAKALRAGEAFKTPEGVVVAKSKVGDALYGVLKAQNDRTAKLADDLAKRDEEMAVSSFAKRADELGFGVEFGGTLRKAYGGDATAQLEVEKRIRGLQEQVAQGAVFKNFGHNSPDANSAEAAFLAKVEELQKANPGLTDQQAYAKAYTAKANADIVKRMKAEASA